MITFITTITHTTDAIGDEFFHIEITDSEVGAIYVRDYAANAITLPDAIADLTALALHED
jgi:hypothetical protein